MKVIELNIEILKEASWNPNHMDESMMSRLRASLTSFGLVQNLVVRDIKDGFFEVLSGNQRLTLLKEMNVKTVPCVVVDLDDAHARLLAQVLNRVQGEDDLGLKAESLKNILKSLPQEDILSLLPETASSLQSLTSLNSDNIADYLQTWQRAQTARLKHLGFQLTSKQLAVVEEALQHLLPEVGENQNDNPNAKGTALYLLCEKFLQNERKEK